MLRSAPKSASDLYAEQQNRLALKKARAKLREHNSQGWDGQGSKKRESNMAGNIKMETKASQNKYPGWKRKQVKLQDRIKQLNSP